MSHYVNKCKHGVIMGQCRCMGPKPTRLVECPPGHEDMLDPSVLDPAPAPTEGWYGTMLAQHKERTAIVAFIREQARVALDVAASPQSAFVVAAAFLEDVASKVERGEHCD